ncbi:sodium:calcium antiporter [Methanopyrus sp.]
MTVELIEGLAEILLGSWVFTNAVEWLGYRFKLPSGFLGSFVAAVATALPETLVPIVALLTGCREGVAIGAILGAPLMLSTLAMGMGGIAVALAHALGHRDSPHVRCDQLRLDATHFLAAYSLALLATVFNHRTLRYAVAITLLLLYARYLRRLMREGAPPEAPSIPLRVANPVAAAALAALLIAASVALMVLGAEGFARGVEALSLSLGLSPLLVSSLLTPVATELPEKVNSVIWYARGRDRLALGNVTGAMVFQATFPVSIGLTLTRWNLSTRDLAYLAVPMIAVLALYVRGRRGRLDWPSMVAVSFLYPVPALVSSG